MVQSGLARLPQFTARALLHAQLASGLGVEEHSHLWQRAYPYARPGTVAGGLIRNTARLTDDGPR